MVKFTTAASVTTGGGATDEMNWVRDIDTLPNEVGCVDSYVLMSRLNLFYYCVKSAVKRQASSFESKITRERNNKS